MPYLTIGQISPGELIQIYSGCDMKTQKLFTKQLLKLDFIRSHYRNSIDTERFAVEELTFDQVKNVERWIEGRTDNDFINAIMHKILSMGNASLTSKF